SVFYRLSMSNCLPVNECRVVFQDSRGFIWIGTVGGLVRYDGHKMKVFRNIPGDSASIASDHVVKIYEDNDSFLWIAHYKGLAQFDPRTEKFINYYFQDFPGGPLYSAYVSDFVKQGNEIYISSAKGLRQIDFSKKTIVPVPGLSSAGKIKGGVNVISKLSDQELLLGTTEGLYLVNCKTKQLFNYRLPSSTSGKDPHNTIIYVY